MPKKVDNYSKGVKAHSGGDYEKALSYFNLDLEQNPNKIQSLYGKAEALKGLNKIDEALDYLIKITELETEGSFLGLSWCLIGEIHNDQGKYTQAIDFFSKAIDTEPSYFLYWINRGEVFEELNDDKKALSDYNNAIKVAPKKGMPYFYKGKLLLKQGSFPDALDHFNKSIDYFKKDKQTNWIEVVQYWVKDTNKRLLEFNTKKAPSIEEQFIRKIRETLQKSPEDDPLTIIREREQRYEKYFQKPRTIDSKSCFLAVLRRWNSFTPKIPNRGMDKCGGGYFLVWKGKGIVIDPGFDFMKNFDEEGYSIRDIDAIILTHAHTDHTADLETILSLIFELSDRTGIEHDIDLFMNLGTVNKFIGWVSRVKCINNIVSLNAGDSINPQGYDLSLNVKDAKHPEIIGDNAIGLVFDLYEGIKTVLKLGFTSDTGWSSKIQNQYRGCKLLVLHLGSIGPNEFDENLPLRGKRRLYNHHLGLIGTISLMKTIKPNLGVISEFGEELGIDRCEIAKNLDRVFGDNNRCLTGDIGLNIKLPDLKVNCYVCKKYEDYQDIKEFPIRAKEKVIYHCSSHTAEDVIDKLI